MVNKATFKCKVYGDADSVVIQDWTRDKKRISAGTLYYISKYDTESFLIVKNLTLDSAGVYQCILDSGGTKRSCNYTLGRFLFQNVNIALTLNLVHVKACTCHCICVFY